MAEFNDNSNVNSQILLARNTPVALVVGCAGFIGSCLSKELLDKKLQVIGIDDFSTGKRENIKDLAKENKFHFINADAGNLSLEVGRLDYIFLAAEDGWDIENVLKLAQKHHCRILLVSSINLYDSKSSSALRWLKKTEERLARFSKENNLNARIVRLASVFGPRMHFREGDPATRLIQAALTGQLQKEGAVMDFSSRDIFVSDAVDLIVKAMLSGSTAQKIFDGALLTPVKVTEIKQVLLDPMWYESRGFEPTELPPWPTPNLEKTQKHLNWKPKTSLIKGLKETLSFFKDNEISVPQVREPELGEFKKTTGEGASEPEEPAGEPEKDLKDEKKGKRGWSLNLKLPGLPKLPKNKFKLSEGLFLTILALGIIFYALIWPLISLGVGALTFRYHLTKASQALSQGDFKNSYQEAKLAGDGVNRIKNFVDSFEAVRKTGLFSVQFKNADNLINLAYLVDGAAQHAILGTQAIYGSVKAVTGEVTDSPANYFDNAQVQLSEADENLSKARALLNDPDFQKNVPGILNSRVNDLSDRVKIYGTLVGKAKAISLMMPQMVAMDGKKSYLVILQNNGELRPTGGFIGSFAQVDFEGGKLKKLEVNDIYNIDGQLKIHVEPPAPIKEDLGQKDWFLRDANWEPDFPTSARQIEWFYNQETGVRVDGVVALDITAMSDLLSVTGPIALADYNNETINSDNLFEKSVAHAEQDFFPGSQAKKNFLTALTNQVLNQLFFVPNQNWPAIVNELGLALDRKDLMIYLSDAKLFSYLVSQNWTGALPRPKEQASGQTYDFLSPVEANLGANKANYYLTRTYNLATTVGKDGEISHRLKINYVNRSPGNTWPAGLYKNYMRVYLPFGTKLNRLLWGNVDITSQAKVFVDYGRTVYGFLIELNPKEEKTLVMDYSVPQAVTFKDDKASYSLDVIKEAGTGKDPFEWTISFPINYHLGQSQGLDVGPQEHNVSTDLSTDRRFEISFSK